MSNRKYNKDHLKEHAGVNLAAPVRVEAPDSGDPLVFWTQHEDLPREVNLHPFAAGQERSNHKSIGSGRKFVPFSARPDLIRQLAPAIEEALSFAAPLSVDSYMNALREWWRILDAVEAAAAMAGQPMDRVEDVRLLTHVHSEFAHRIGMFNHQFGKIRSLVDTTCMALGARKTYWELPEISGTQKHIPPQEQRNALRFAVRNACRNVLERWVQSDSGTAPEDTQEAHLWRNGRYMRNIQKKTGKALPTANELRDGISKETLSSSGIKLVTLRESVFPNHRDADAVWHQCLLNTGWNPSTLSSLDVTKKILVNHFKDDPYDPHRRFVLRAKTVVV